MLDVSLKNWKGRTGGGWSGRGGGGGAPPMVNSRSNTSLEWHTGSVGSCLSATLSTHSVQDLNRLLCSGNIWHPGIGGSFLWLSMKTNVFSSWGLGLGWYFRETHCCPATRFHPFLSVAGRDRGITRRPGHTRGNGHCLCLSGARADNALLRAKPGVVSVESWNLSTALANGHLAPQCFGRAHRASRCAAHVRHSRHPRR